MKYLYTSYREFEWFARDPESGVVHIIGQTLERFTAWDGY